MKSWCFIFIALLVSVTAGYSEERSKKVYIITGPEASGSRFIARIIAHVIDKDRHYGSWSGLGVCGEIGDDVLVVHRSQPAFRPAQFTPLEVFEQMFDGYDRFFIITTRDLNIVKQSKERSYGGSKHDLNVHEKISKQILSEILLKEKCFIWNYETQLFLKEVYFQKLYEFLQVESSFFPPDLFDGNQKYFGISF